LIQGDNKRGEGEIRKEKEKKKRQRAKGEGSLLPSRCPFNLDNLFPLFSLSQSFPFSLCQKPKTPNGKKKGKEREEKEKKNKQTNKQTNKK